MFWLVMGYTEPVHEKHPEDKEIEMDSEQEIIHRIVQKMVDTWVVKSIGFVYDDEVISCDLKVSCMNDMNDIFSESVYGMEFIRSSFDQIWDDALQKIRRNYSDDR